MHSLSDAVKQTSREGLKWFVDVLISSELNKTILNERNIAIVIITLKTSTWIHNTKHFDNNSAKDPWKFFKTFKYEEL